MGTILATLFSGLLAHSLGWEAVFYLQGSLALLVVSVWLYWAYDSPALHPRIKPEEKEYIQSSTVIDTSPKVFIQFIVLVTN